MPNEGRRWGDARRRAHPIRTRAFPLITVLYYARRITRGIALRLSARAAEKRDAGNLCRQPGDVGKTARFMLILLSRAVRISARASLSVQHVSRLRYVERGESEDGRARGKWDGLRTEIRSRGVGIAKETSAPTRGVNQSLPLLFASRRKRSVDHSGRNAANGIILAFPGRGKRVIRGKKNTRDKLS